MKNPITRARKNALPASRRNGWLPLGNLPTYALAEVRAMGGMLFSALTRTPLADIEVMRNGDLAAFPIPLGEHKQVIEIASDSLPALGGARYHATAVLYCRPEHSYLLVEDFAGKYWYRWPASDNLGDPKNGREIAAGLARPLLAAKK